MQFGHSCDALLDSRCMRLVHELGYAGYGLYWGLVETLLKQDNQTLPLASLGNLATRMRVRAKTLNRLVRNYDLFEICNDGKSFRSLPDKLHTEVTR